MIHHKEKEFSFLCRSAAVIIHNKRILLCINRDLPDSEKHWFLPGGRMERLEDSRKGVVREIAEELEAECTIDRLLWIVENFFDFEGTAHQEVGFYYFVSLKEGSSILNEEERTINDFGTTIGFQWFPLSALPPKLFPSFLYEELKELPAETRHVIHIDKD